MSEELQRFHLILTHMLSTDKEARTGAEGEYEQIPILQRSTLLFQIYAEPSVAEEHRALSLVLLRRLVSNHWEDLLAIWGEENQRVFCAQLLQAAQTETSEHLRRKVGDLIAEVARNSVDDETGAQKWPDIVQFIQHCSTADHDGLKEMALSIIEDVPNVFGTNQAQCLGGVKVLLETCLGHASAKVRSAALKAYVSYISENDDDEKVVKTLAALVPNVIRVCEHVVQTEDDDDTPLQCLADLATTVPKTLQAHIPNIIRLCVETIRDTNKEEAYRHSSMEVLTSLCENAPNMVKKRAANYLGDILQSCLILMTELEEDIADWLAQDDPEQDDEEESVAVGESSLDRIACALNGKVVLPIFLQLANSLLLDQNDWKKRHAGLMGLSTVGEGCQRTMEPLIPQIVNNIIPFLNDSHPRVRYAACNALGQMSTDFSPTLQKKCHDKVVAGLLGALSDASCPRVSAHAGAALVNFSEDCPKNVISAYLPAIMEKLEMVLESTFRQLVGQGKKIVLEQVITTIASVADAAQDLFVEYYDRLITPLKYILEHSNGEDFKILRGKTIECISLVGLAVGTEKFEPDAREIMNLVSATTADLSPDDPQCSYFISSWTRICKVLGPKFAEYLPMVMPPIMRAASYNPDVTVVDDEDVSDDPAWTFHSVGEKKNFGIRTSGIEEKATACDMIVCYARELKEAFLPYVDEVSTLMVGHLKFFFHEGVRTSAAETLPHLLACVKAAGGVPAMRRLWEGYWPALKEAIPAEVETEVTAEFLNCIAECIEQLGAEGLSAEEIQGIAELMKEQMSEYEKRRVDREQAEADEDADEEEAKEQLDEEAEMESAILARVSDINHAAFKELGEAFFPLVEPMLTGFFSLLNPQRVYTDRQWSACILDDLIEFAPQSSLRYQNEIGQALGQCLNDEFPEVRQAAAYGFGIMALRGDDWQRTACSALEGLAVMISRPDARATEESTVATENAISAVAKILKNAKPAFNVDSIIHSFFTWLPVVEDKEESIPVYSFFADLVEGNHPIALGHENSNLPRILDIIVKAFHNNAFDETDDAVTVKTRLLSILKYIQSNPEIFNACIASSQTSNDERDTLQKLITLL